MTFLILADGKCTAKRAQLPLSTYYGPALLSNLETASFLISKPLQFFAFSIEKHFAILDSLTYYSEDYIQYFYYMYIFICNNIKFSLNSLKQSL